MGVPASHRQLVSNVGPGTQPNSTRDLVERAILLSTKEDDQVLDLFSGTGTVIRVCKRLKRSTTSIELNYLYCTKLKEEHPELLFA